MICTCIHNHVFQLKSQFVNIKIYNQPVKKCDLFTELTILVRMKLTFLQMLQFDTYIYLKYFLYSHFHLFPDIIFYNFTLYRRS